MKFAYAMPTKVIFGRDCVKEQGALLRTLGDSALIVTGRSSAHNGALRDVEEALAANGQDYTLFDRVAPNPAVACVREGVQLAKAAGADFVIGLGGGSPMDAAKAIATLAVQERADDEIFAGGYEDRALPMAHIPTTAGTGSEVTPYAILTNDAMQTKTSITSYAMFPRLAFLDGKYMLFLPQESTVNTALDALSHAAEGMLSRNATPLSDLYAEESLRILAPILPRLRGALSADDRDMLLYASCLAGMAIAQSGTTAVHGMGYYLTYFYGIDHGRANGLLLGETLRLCCEKGLAQADRILRALHLADADAFCSLLSSLLGRREDIPRERLLDFGGRSVSNKNIKKSIYEPTAEELARIFLRSFA